MSDSGSAVVVAVDQGTSSTKALAVDARGNVVGWGSVAIGQTHPAPGWVEQDAREIAASVEAAIAQAVDGLAGTVSALALSTQRESALLWDRATGEPLGPVLGWQDRRTTDAADSFTAAGHGERQLQLTGLPVDPMFSALKFAWLLDRVDPDRVRASAGELCLGTVDSWLVFRLTSEHRIEAGNASRTALLDLATGDWSEELLAVHRIPRAALPRIAPSTEPTAPVALASLPEGTRITGILGDSHAALFGHGVRLPGAVKVTLGTGSSIMGLLPAGRTAPEGLVTTLAWAAPEPALAFEGNILSSGSTLVWLAGLLGTTPDELADLAREASGEPDTGVDLVPAFAGLGAPWWDDRAQAVLIGFDLATDRSALARAALESVVLQIEDVLRAAEAAGPRIESVLIDGGPAANDHLAQLLADLSGRRVERPDIAGLSALGAAHLAGLAAGLWTPDDVLAFDRRSTVFTPSLPDDVVAARLTRWHRAVAVARGRAAEPTT
ncbi:FGGY family carbohydrate kinase [Galbitalea soli]|uniref:Glycerol kinase n=1 Tax=Galbitalea soli TaxID=1268042 RepID=A0A7C9TSW7_9MICO|nr:FGGY family carbohydrate kinase [Galbitalea soli]NEM92044.1 glycerol kinase [Galbitalea soli]NYJ32004.1 glycerol kinase [Galbitalea soli]